MYKKTAFPKHIQLQTHSLCNLKCTLCPHPMLGLNSIKDTLSFKYFTNIIDEAASFKDFQSIVLDLQNEPLLDADLERKIAYIKSKRKDIFIGITTNGVGLNGERVRDLIVSGVDRIVVSLNAVNSTEYAETVKTVKFSKILSNLQQALSVKGANNIVKLSFGITNKNLSSLTKFIKHFDDLGIKYRYYFMNSRINTIKDSSLIAMNDSKSNPFPKSLYNEDYQYTKICQIPLYSLTIKLNGNVITCCEDWFETKVFGNVFESSIQEIWNSYELRQMRENIFSFARLPKSPCGKCESLRHLPYPTFGSSNDISFYESGAGFTRDEVDNCTNIIPIYRNYAWWFKNIFSGSMTKVSEAETTLFELNPIMYLANNMIIERMNLESDNFVPIHNITIDGCHYTGNYFPALNEIVLQEDPYLDDNILIDFTITTTESGVEVYMQGKYEESKRIIITDQQCRELTKFMLWSYGWQKNDS
jgi:radical SAM protein with 4Fe4S-binding SPASM domain